MGQSVAPFRTTRLALLCATLCATLCVASPGVAAATPVVGALTFTGSMSFGGTSLSFSCALVCPANSGSAQVAPVDQQSGSFIALANAAAYDRNLAFLGGQPINTAFVLSDFLSFVGATDIAVDLGFIAGGGGAATCTAVLFTPCTPRFAALVTPSNPLGLSPYLFITTPTGSSLTISLAGTARRISTGETSSFTGTLTTQFVGVTSAQLASTLATGASVTAPFSAVLSATAPVTTTPEPATVALLAPTLLALGGLARRQRSPA